MLADFGKQLAASQKLLANTSGLYQKRSQVAAQRATERLRRDFEALAAGVGPLDYWSGWSAYLTDAAQRSILFWDTLRQRGNVFIEHERAGKPPLLHFDYEMIVDARTFDPPVNYALLKIIPPSNVTIDNKRRPYIIIDPRAGHGPGIGGFKEDSQVGVALRDGHPVYFVIFFPQPEPGQTLLDVAAAERAFIAEVRRRHPHSPKPVLIGNCQGGWAAMMLAASDPQDTGPVVINGAPMSYWGGAFSEGEGDNPMRYSGGMLGGSWLSSLMADLGNGVFDGAWLVQNFENLHPSNTFWSKYYHVYANVDTEPPRFLEFERWWGGFFLMNREEIEWIVRNLFVGNKLWDGSIRSHEGEAFDLRNIRSPIVLFASMGDNITPPQQAFNWVADVYASTEEIKARGQVIVGLLHEDIGHLGIFVSGRVAKKEHAQIVSVLKSIEALPPGLYGMQIKESKGAGGKTDYEVQFIEHTLEDVVARLNRAQRRDESAFESVAKLSELNQRAYELFMRPWVRAFSTEQGAQLGRMFHPLRWQRWAFSDLNPALAWLGPAAALVKGGRQALPADAPLRKLEKLGAESIGTAMDLYRDMRDAATEFAFFQTYGNLYAAGFEDKDRSIQQPHVATRKDPLIAEALAGIERGGYVAAVARAASLLANRNGPLPLSRLELKRELMADYAELLPELSAEEQRRLRGQQDIICKHAPKRALETLPSLLAEPADRQRFLRLLGLVESDPRVHEAGITEQQREMAARLRAVLAEEAAVRSAKVASQVVRKPAGAPRAAAKPAPKAKPKPASGAVAKAVTKTPPKVAAKSSAKAVSKPKAAAATRTPAVAKAVVPLKPRRKVAANG